MSRDVSGLRLLLPSPDNIRTRSNDRRRYLRFAVLLLTVLAGIVGASAMRTASSDAVAFLQNQSETVQNTTIILIASAFALVVLGAYRRVVERGRRLGPGLAKPRVLAVTSEPAADFWRAQEEERKQISRELHDSVGQLLTVAGLELRAVRSNHQLPARMREDLEETCRLNAEALRQVRDLAMGLRPALLDDVNLVANLEWEARQFFRQTGISAVVEACGDSDALPEAHRICIYRCVQEALTNCAKHARAKNVHILVSVSGKETSVVIEDDGIGLVESASPRGLGLLGMRERVAGVRGTFSIARRNQGGTAVTLHIPVTGGALA